MPVNFFSVHHAYATDPQACEQMKEFQTLVLALHEADIEVVLDVTYNHTAEADENGPTYSYPGGRQHHLLFAGGRSQQISQRYGLRQHVALCEPLCAKDDYRQHAVLGQRDARRWISVRSRVRLYGAGGEVDLSWTSHSPAFCLHGESQNDTDLYVMINAYWEPLLFKIQEGQASDWLRVVDTSMASPEDICEPGRESRILSSTYIAQPRSTVVFIRK